MNLKKIFISNFRSIKEMEIEIKELNNKKCIILVGKNEAGKSNILKAIAALYGQYKISKKDKRKTTNEEDINNENSFIRTIYELNQDDFKNIYQKFNERYQNSSSIVFQNNLTIEDLIKEVFYEILLAINIDNNSKAHLYYWWNEKLSNKYIFKEKVFLENNRFNQENKGKELNIELLTENTFSIIENDFDKDTLIKWEYKEEYIFPDKISLSKFIENPDSCIPLKALFEVCNKKNISDDLKLRQQDRNALVTYLEQISKNSTQKFQKIWEDLKKIKFELQKDGDNIYINIKEKAIYSAKERSDGFQRFLAILIMLSAPAQTKKINSNCIILLDEPDTSLYPTSAQFLRKELLKISENALVIYSTHSPFMIDTDCIERHLVIERVNEESKITKKENSPFQEDELIRRAIGTHIFDNLKPINIIFEGYTDYIIFKKIHSSKDFIECGFTYLAGIKEINPFISIFILTNKKFIIVSDSDEGSKSKKQDFQKNYPDFDSYWVEYSKINNKISTLEDFYKEEYTQKYLKGYKPNTSISTVKNLENYIKNKGVQDVKAELKKTKYTLARNVKKENLKEEYLIFLNELKEKVKTCL